MPRKYPVRPRSSFKDWATLIILLGWMLSWTVAGFYLTSFKLVYHLNR